MKSTAKTDPKRIFVDTSAWVEMMLTQEKYHTVISSYFKTQSQIGSHFFTSDYVLDEAFTGLLTNQSLTSAQSLRRLSLSAEKSRQLVIMWTDESLFEKSWCVFVKFAEHKLSFTDAVIATLVKDFKINEILTLDQGFRKIGLMTKPEL